jgi:tRNA(fMet)-specific endonuclease VapC
VIYLPDTNGWIGYLRRRHTALIQRFQAERASDIMLCSVVVAELAYGAYHSPAAFRAHNLSLLAKLQGEFASIPFDDAAADEYGRLRAHLAASGLMIGPNDLMIASIALARGLILVTHNVREFSRVPGLVVEDWQGP